MMTVKFYNSQSNDRCLVECDHVHISDKHDTPGSVMVCCITSGKQTHEIEVSSDSPGYHWLVAYVMNASGRTIETIRPTGQPLSGLPT